MIEGMPAETDRNTLRRLERLPMTWVQMRLLVMGGLGYTFDAMDLGIVAPIIIGYAFAGIGFGGIFFITTAVLLAGALAVGILGIRTSGKTLE